MNAPGDAHTAGVDAHTTRAGEGHEKEKTQKPNRMEIDDILALNEHEDGVGV